MKKLFFLFLVLTGAAFGQSVLTSGTTMWHYIPSDADTMGVCSNRIIGAPSYTWENWHRAFWQSTNSIVSGSPAGYFTPGVVGPIYTITESQFQFNGVLWTPPPPTNAPLSPEAITNRVSFRVENGFLFDLRCLARFYDASGNVISAVDIGSAPGSSWDPETFSFVPGNTWVSADTVPFPAGAVRMEVGAYAPNAAVAGLLGAFGFSVDGVIPLPISDLSWSASLSTGGSPVEKTESVTMITLNDSEPLESVLDTTVSDEVGPTPAQSAATTVEITCGPPSEAVSSVNAVVSAAGGSSSSPVFSNYAASAAGSAVGSSQGSSSLGGGSDLSGVIGAVNSVGTKVDALGTKIEALPGEFISPDSIDPETTGVNDGLLSEAEGGIAEAKSTVEGFLSSAGQAIAFNFPTVNSRQYVWNIPVSSYSVPIDLTPYQDLIEAFRTLLGWVFAFLFIIYCQSIIRKGIA